MTDNALEDRSHLYVDAAGRVDVAKLITAYSHQDHAHRADQYFANVAEPWTHFLRKPFSSLTETPGILAGYSVILRILEPRPDQVVVDFGCGTGWLSQAMGMMGCTAVGLDISEAALGIARKAVAEHPYLSTRPITFLQIGDGAIPMADESADRLVCFDSFHHVADQAAWLKEFYRVLKPGGRVAFHEPGPHHSECEGAQYEMRQYGVIENNIVVETIRDTAYGLGFTDMKLAFFLDVPVMTSLEEHNRYMAEAPVDEMARLGMTVVAAGAARRIFVMSKPGEEVLDSRYIHAFQGTIEGSIQPTEQGSRIVARLRNTGPGAWRTSGAAAGCVNLAVSLFLDHKPLTGEPLRYQVVTESVPPGGHLDVDIEVPHPPGARLRMDLVSELIAWSSQNGGSLLTNV